MTVGDLIEKLKELPMDLPVRYLDEEGPIGWAIVDEVRRQDIWDGGYLHCGPEGSRRKYLDCVVIY